MSNQRMVLHQNEINKILNPIATNRQRSHPTSIQYHPPTTNNTENTDNQDITPPGMTLNIAENPESSVDIETLADPNTHQDSNIEDPEDLQRSDTNENNTKSTERSLLSIFQLRSSNFVLSDIKQLTNGIVTLPHKSSDSWWQLYPLIVAMTILSAVLPIALFAVDLNSVNDGLQNNRRFLYGFLTWYQYLGLVPWIETFNYALPEGSLPLRARILAVFVGLGVQKLADAIIAESWWNPGAPLIFPIPFSTIVSCTVSLPFSLWTLWCFLPTDERSKRKFFQCRGAAFTILLTIFVSGLWAVVFRILQGSVWQSVWGGTFFLVRFFSKNQFMAHIAIKLNPHRWILLCLAVDLITTRIHVSTLPYMGSIWVLLSSAGPGYMLLLFRFYSGGDRLGILFGTYWNSYVRGKNTQVDLLAEHLGTSNMIELASRVLGASLSNLHSMGMRLYEASSNHTYENWGDNNNNGNEDDDTMEATLEGMSSSSEEGSSLSENDSEDELSRIERGITTPIFEESRSDCDESQCNENDSLNDGLTNESVHSCESFSTVSLETTCLEEGDGDSANSASLTQTPTLQKIQRQCSILEVECEHNIASVDSTTDSDSDSDSIGNCEEVVHTVQEEQIIVESVSVDSDIESNSEDEIENHESSLHSDIECNPVDPLSNTEERQHSEGNIPTVEQRRHDYQQNHENNTNSKSLTQLQELHWEQRQLFHIVDLVGSEILAIITQVHHQFAICIVRHLPIQKHLNASFDIDDDQWRLANFYGCILICVNIIMVASLTFWFRRIEKLEGRELRLNAVIAYIFRDNFWFVFHWMTAMGAIACITLINHFGADFTLHFDWLHCPNNMAWPLCVTD